MLKRVRQSLAVICIVLVTLLFLDFTGVTAWYFGWVAKIQFLPALLSLNLGVLLALLLLTFICGRIYCSVICPLGVMQDIFARFGKIAKKNRYSFSKAKSWLRYSALVLLILAFLLGFNWVVALFAPYSAYGRIASTLFAPIWDSCNNLLAMWAEHVDSYAFYSVDVRYKGWITLSVAVITLVSIGILGWRNGRTYCNTICPVGTILGFVSRFSIFRPIIDTSKCVDCGLCARNCKSACIDSKNHKIDYSRCVACMDCISKCRKGAISYTWRRNSCLDKTENSVENIAKQNRQVDDAKRTFLTTTATVAVASALKAGEKKVDGGLAMIEDKKVPNRKRKIVPPGALSIRNLERHCTACQLCISECPNGVLRPSTSLESLMQPESSYEVGYCRPECTRCSNVCPTGAIRPISREDKSSIQIGHAVWVKANCIPITDGVSCGNCARHCPAGAITMIPSVPGDDLSLKIPAVNTELCIGCGACENLCPARPFSAIYVEGHEVHREI